MVIDRPRVSAEMRKRSRELRKNMTSEEKKIWYQFLRKYEYPVARQYVLGDYIADFYCAKARLIIEIDGAQHYDEAGQNYDAERTRFFETYGLEVIRLTNLQVNKQFRECCQYLDCIIKERVNMCKANLHR